MVKTFPKTLGACIDALYSARALRLEQEKVVESMKAQERELKQLIMAQLAADKIDGAKGKIATAAIMHKRVPVVLDWPTFWAFARKDKLGVYVQKRIAVEATRELFDAGKEVPGAALEEVIDLSLTKAGG